MSKPEELKTMVELAGEHAKQVMIGLHRQLMPTWVLIDHRGHVSIIGTPWRDDAEKAYFRAKMRKMMRDKKTVAYSFVCEAWTSHWSGDKPGPDDPGFVRPMDDPNRHEVVLAIATDGKLTQGASWKTVRDSHEQVCALERMKDIDDSTTLLGTMTTLLD